MENIGLKQPGLDTDVFLKNILDGLSMGGLFVDKSRIIRHCNAAAENIFGYSRDELVGKRTDVLYGDRRLDASNKNEIRDHLSSHGYHVGTATGIKKDGAPISLDLYTFIVKEDAGAAIMVRRAQERAINAESLLGDLMDNIPDVIYFKDASNRFLMVNKAHAAALGLKPEDVIGKTDLDFFPADIAKKYYADDSMVVKTGKPIIDKIEAAGRPDGRMAYVSTTKIPRYDKYGRITGTIGITRDVTERIAAQEELRRYKDNLEGLVKERTAQLEQEHEKLMGMFNLKSEFVSTVSHELRTPLTVIRGNVDIVHDGTAGPLNEKQKSFLEIALNNADRLARLISDILDLSKLETGKMKYRIIKANLNELISQVVKSYEIPASKKGISLEKRLDPTLPLVDIDQDRINQVLCNLFSNAIKFTATGRVSVMSKTQPDSVMVTVSDTGIGIRDEDMCRIFEKFEQVHAEGEVKYEGTGLGLAICKQIIEQTGGKIWAESQYGKGSSFSFTLPIKRR